MASNKSRLASAMKTKGRIEADDVEDTTGEQAPEPEAKRSLSLAPVPVEEPEAEEPVVEGPVAAEPEPVAAADPEPAAEAPAEDPTPPDVATEVTTEAPVEPAAQAEPQAAPAQVPSSEARTQKASVLAGVGQVDLGFSTQHLTALMESGRDQRAYVNDLPPRSQKGTYVRLPVHLQKALDVYCDRNSAPMADFVAAVLDSYFRDLGLLPPMGGGHRPVKEFVDKMRASEDDNDIYADLY